MLMRVARQFLFEGIFFKVTNYFLSTITLEVDVKQLATMYIDPESV